MHLSKTFIMANWAAIALGSDAPAVLNPLGAHYLATGPGSTSAGDTSIIIQVSIETPSGNSSGALVTVNLNGPVLSGGPFLYGINNQQVVSNGACSGIDDHLDPYDRTINPPCDASQPQTCEVGDLSGKHGDISSLPGFSTQYIDLYLSLVPETPAYIGNRSFVLYYHNGIAVACANFVAINSGSNTVVASGSTVSPGLTPSASASGQAGTTVTTVVSNAIGVTAGIGSLTTASATVIAGVGSVGAGSALSGTAMVGTTIHASVGAITTTVSAGVSLGLGPVQTTTTISGGESTSAAITSTSTSTMIGGNGASTLTSTYTSSPLAIATVSQANVARYFSVLLLPISVATAMVSMALF